MPLPNHLAALPGDTAIWVSGKLSVEDWCRTYVDSGYCAEDWAYLHAQALLFLEKHQPSGTAHGFAGDFEVEGNVG